jgi:hypothetical protein
LAQELVNQGGFTVINVGDNGDITECAFSHVKLLKLRIRLVKVNEQISQNDLMG